jgi:hypothetical protein
MKRRSNLLLYLLLNILVSAATTLAVLTLWDTYRKSEVPPPVTLAQEQAAAPAEAQPAPAAAEPDAPPPTPQPTATLPPLDRPIIEIASVIGVGDLNQEFVLLRRVGEGNLVMTGWRLAGERGSSYTFPAQPELTLYKDGAVLIYSKAGDNTAAEVFWDRSQPAWESGEVVRLYDRDGGERANYIVP